MARGLMVQLPTADEPAVLYNALASHYGDPKFLSNVFAEYLKDPWCKMPSVLRERYGSAPSAPAISAGPSGTKTVAVIEIQEGGVITTHPLEVTAPEKKPDGYNALTSPTRVTPMVMRKRAANS
jgi:hypothetical protein